LVLASGLTSILVTDFFAAALGVPGVREGSDSRRKWGAAVSGVPGRTGPAAWVPVGALCLLDGSADLGVDSSPVPVGALWPVESLVPASVPVPADCFGGLPIFDGLSFLVFGDEGLLMLVPFCDADFGFPL
jgi:hypothetical protein